jgi:hypothetical protein
LINKPQVSKTIALNKLTRSFNFKMCVHNGVRLLGLFKVITAEIVTKRSTKMTESTMEKLAERERTSMKVQVKYWGGVFVTPLSLKPMKCLIY